MSFNHRYLWSTSFVQDLLRTGRLSEAASFRYFPLSVTVGWKFVVAMFLALWLIPVTLAGQSADSLGWSATVALAVINIGMFWRIGLHLGSLSRETGA